MLERAACCFESAGRRFLRDADGGFRTRRSLARHFWKHNVALGSISAWLPALLHVSDQTAPSALNSTHGCTSANDACSPFLDFLYPWKAQELAVSKLFRHSRRLGLRRRKRSVGGSLRAYSTEATNLQKILLDDRNAPLPEPKEINIAKHALKDLRILLRLGGKEFDKAWVLYLTAGRPRWLRRRLFRYVIESTQTSDLDHAWQIFQEMPRKYREDFRKITRAQFHYEQPCFSRLKSLCVEAIAMGFGEFPCGYTFEYYAKRGDWAHALDIWDLRSPSVTVETDKQHLEMFFSRINRSTLPSVAYDLGNFLAASRHNNSARDLAESLLEKISASHSVLANTPMDILLRFIGKYLELGFFKETHYFIMIQTLQTSVSRQVFIRSVLLYHHLRRNLPGAKPPTKLLNVQLASLAKFEITDGAHFFLNEFTHFWGKPSIEAYKQALVLFSRAADVQQVNAIFDRLVADHGAPRSRRLLTPLLAVHARTGNVQETIAQFRRVAEEFLLEQNTTCWNILLKAYAAKKDPEGALRTFVQMVDQGATPDSHTFGTLMGICAGRGDIDGTRWLLKEAQRRSVKITMPMLDTIAQVYCQNRRPDLAEKLARAAGRMKIKGSAIRMWNMILLQYALRVDRAGWVRSRDFMARNRLKPDAMTLAARLLLSALQNKPEEARQFLRKMHKQRTIQATELHYSIVLFAYLRTRNRPMVRIILNEALERFGHTMSASSLSRLMAHVDHDLEFVEKEEGPDTHDAHLRLEDTEKSLIRSFGSFDGTVLADKFAFLKEDHESSSNGLSTSQYEYLVSHYGTSGTIQEAKAMFDKYLESRNTAKSPEDELEPIPFRIVTVMMRAHMAADELDKVQEFWHLALSNAIKVARPLKLDQFFASTSLGSSTSAHSESSPGRSLKTPDALVHADLFSPEHPASRKQSNVLPSKRFILSRPFNFYLRALAYQNKTEEIPQAVNQLEAAGFELSGTNWSTYVQMMAASDRQVDLIEAFQVFEHKFMPNFPGWSPLRRGWALKPENAPESTHLLEFKTLHYAKLQRQKYGSFLGRQARKHWRKLEPEVLMPTYVTTVYLKAALNRVRSASIAKGRADLTALYDAAPKTIRMLGEMPYLGEKYQGRLIRGGEQRPEPPPMVHDQTIAFGGALGKGARARFNWDLRDPRIIGRLPGDDQPSSVHQPTEDRHQPEDQQSPKGQQPMDRQQSLENPQPMQDVQSTEQLGEDYWDIGTPSRRKWPRFPFIEPTSDNETVRLLADILSPEDSSGSRESSLSHEDRLDIEGDIRFLATMRSLKQAKRLAEEREQAHREALDAARRPRQSSSLAHLGERGEDDDGFKADLEELERLDELHPEDPERVDKPQKVDEPDLEDSEDLFDGQKESDVEDSDLSEDADSLDQPGADKSEVNATNELDVSDLAGPEETEEDLQHQEFTTIIDRARQSDVNRQSDAEGEDAETSRTTRGEMQ